MVHKQKLRQPTKGKKRGEVGIVEGGFATFHYPEPVPVNAPIFGADWLHLRPGHVRINDNKTTGQKPS
jgi:hypothetical protein